MSVFVYILKCADGRYYTGTTRGSLEHRVDEHNAGTFAGYTVARRPVELMYSEEFDRITDAIAMERRIKGWRREKKEALINGDFVALRNLSKPTAKRRSSFDTRASLTAQDEGNGTRVSLTAQDEGEDARTSFATLNEEGSRADADK